MLRRVFNLVFCLLIIISLAACSKKSKSEQPITTGFSCGVDVSCNDMNVKGRITRSSAGTLLFEVEEPKTLNGMTMQWDGDSVSLKLFGLSFDVNPENIPQTALARSILNVLDAAVGMHGEGEETKEGLVTKGTASIGEFEILSDSKTGNLLKLRIPSAGLTASFSDFATEKPS